MQTNLRLEVLGLAAYLDEQTFETLKRPLLAGLDYAGIRQLFFWYLPVRLSSSHGDALDSIGASGLGSDLDHTGHPY
jgi:hypothetical protein